MIVSLILGLAALMTFGLLCFLLWRIFYRGAGFDASMCAIGAFLAFVALAVAAALKAVPA